MAQQTAVEWITERLILNELLFFITEEEQSLFNKLVEQAKEMEKQQIINAHLTGLIHPLEIEATIQAEQYYNENYGK